MAILVPIKRVIDYNVKIKVKPDNSGVEKSNVKHIINPFDEIALEEAIKLKEQNHTTDIIAITIGNNESDEQMLRALAMGADKAVLIENDLPNKQSDFTLTSLDVAKILQQFIKANSIEMVIMGKQAIDDDNNQAGQMLAQLLGWPQACFVSNISIKGDEITTISEVDEGLSHLSMKLPAVITTDLRLNTPRNVALPQIMKAKQKPYDKIKASSLVASSELKNHCEVISISPPPKREGGKIYENIDQAITELKNRGLLKLKP